MTDTKDKALKFKEKYEDSKRIAEDVAAEMFARCEDNFQAQLVLAILAGMLKETGTKQ